MNDGSNFGSFPTATFANCLANSKEIFHLIDQVFPIDSCRHYEVLPLELKGSNLILGMLNPEKEESIRFAQSVAKVLNYDLEIQLIDLQTHQIILANYPAQQAQSGKQQDKHRTVVDAGFIPAQNADFTAATIIDSEANSPAELPDLPADLNFLKDLELTSQDQQSSTQAKPDSPAILFDVATEPKNQKPPSNLDEKATIISENPAETFSQSGVQADEAALTITQLIAETLGHLPIEALEEPPEVKSTDFLPPLASELSWSRLLESVFEHGSDYLQLTYCDDRGNITASKNEIHQSTIDYIPLAIFGALIDEIKQMARLPQDSSSHPQKVALEKFYQQERILLRLEFLPQPNLPEVQVQILRGQALKSYEQQQMERISSHALKLAKQLEKAVARIQAGFNSAELTNIQELQTVHNRISQQLKSLDS